MESDREQIRDKKYPDGGYGWVIVFLSFLLYLIADGIAFSLGLINSVWLDYFKQSETKTSWVGSIFYAMPLLTAPIMAKFVEDHGCKRMTVIGGAISAFGFIVSSLCNSVDQLYLTVGLVGGSGLSAAYIVGLVSVERWFEARRSLAIGIVSAGTGFGTFIFPPIAQYCLDALKWRLTIVVLSGLLMLIPLIGVFLDDPPWKNIENIAKQERKFDKIPFNINTSLENDHKMIRKLKALVDFSHFRNKNFSLLGISSFAIYTLYNTAFYFLPELLRDSDLESAYFISITGFFLMLGMVSLGWISDFKKTNVFMLNSACVLICGLSEALIPFGTKNSFVLSVTCAAFGFTFASAYVLIPRLVELIVGVDNFTSAIGLNFFMQGLGLLVGTPFASWIYGISGSWSISFYVCGGLLALSSIMAFSIQAVSVI